MTDENDTQGQEPTSGTERSADHGQAQQGQGQVPNQRPDDDGGGSQDDLAHLPERDRDYIRQLRSESARRRTANQALTTERDEMAQRLRAIEDRDKSELQKAQERTAELERQNQEFERDRLVATIAKDKGIPREWEDRLRGDTREALEEDADRLKTMIGDGDANNGGHTYTDFDAGVRGGGVPGKPDMNLLIRRSAGRG